MVKENITKKSNIDQKSETISQLSYTTPVNGSDNAVSLAFTLSDRSTANSETIALLGFDFLGNSSVSSYESALHNSADASPRTSIDSVPPWSLLTQLDLELNKLNTQQQLTARSMTPGQADSMDADTGPSVAHPLSVPLPNKFTFDVPSAAQLRQQIGINPNTFVQGEDRTSDNSKRTSGDSMPTLETISARNSDQSTEPAEYNSDEKSVKFAASSSSAELQVDTDFSSSIAESVQVALSPKAEKAQKASVIDKVLDWFFPPVELNEEVYSRVYSAIGTVVAALMGAANAMLLTATPLSVPGFAVAFINFLIFNYALGRMFARVKRDGIKFFERGEDWVPGNSSDDNDSSWVLVTFQASAVLTAFVIAIAMMYKWKIMLASTVFVSPFALWFVGLVILASYWAFISCSVFKVFKLWDDAVQNFKAASNTNSIWSIVRTALLYVGAGTVSLLSQYPLSLAYVEKFKAQMLLWLPASQGFALALLQFTLVAMIAMFMTRVIAVGLGSVTKIGMFVQKQWNKGHVVGRTFSGICQWLANLWVNASEDAFSQVTFGTPIAMLKAPILFVGILIAMVFTFAKMCWDLCLLPALVWNAVRNGEFAEKGDGCFSYLQQFDEPLVVTSSTLVSGSVAGMVLLDNECDDANDSLFITISSNIAEMLYGEPVKRITGPLSP